MNNCAYPKDSGLDGKAPWRIIKEETALSHWMSARKKTILQMCKLLGASDRSVKYWMRGQQLPSLVTAFKIEAITKGAVPVASWLATTVGKAKWRGLKTVMDEDDDAIGNP